MNKLIRFDVLIVYTESLATSASDVSNENHLPFALGSRSESYNLVYGYFLEMCHKFHLKAAFTTSSDIIGPGLCQSFWTFENKKWHKTNSPCFSNLIFDKFSPTKSNIKSRRQLLFSSPNIKPFNDPELFDLFFDKQLTYEKLSHHSIPTISLKDHTLKDINNACQTLTKLIDSHPDSQDFSQDIIMKDRFGAGGRHVYKFKIGQSKDMLAVIRKNTKISFIIQPFANFDQGFIYRNFPSSTDIRLIFLQDKIVQSYIRVAKTGDFRCNEHQGGSLTYLSPQEIPPAIMEKSNLITKLLDKKCSLYALDFIISNNGNAYLLEGNTGPGLDWNPSIQKNEIESKKLINLVIEELTFRIKNTINCLN
jgi:glutathione synthase/RimK-type ligase-like ATP-grasp enzyme